MKIVALHTDFRIYWPSRWKWLSQELERRGKGSLEVIELFGKGSPYAFNRNSADDSLKWHILVPDRSPEEMSGEEIKTDLFRLLDSINPDVIISGAIAFQSGALAVQWALKHKDTRVICFDDAKLSAVSRSKFVNFVKQNVYNGVDMMFYPAELWRETGHFWGFDDNEMVFGIDVVDNEFWRTPSDTPIFQPPYFLSVGRQIKKKNFLGVVRAYGEYLNSVGYDMAIPLILVGDGPEHEAILAQIKELGLGDKIISLPFQSQERVRNLMQNASLLLLLSNEAETWGLVINEAMNCGCAIISTHECGATDVLIKDGVNGYAINYDDIMGTSDALVKYHNLSEVEKKSFSNTSKEIISNWGLERFAESAIRAAEYSLSRPKRKPNIFGRFIISRWFGRYRPV